MLLDTYFPFISFDTKKNERKLFYSRLHAFSHFQNSKGGRQMERILLVPRYRIGKKTAHVNSFLIFFCFSSFFSVVSMPFEYQISSIIIRHRRYSTRCCGLFKTRKFMPLQIFWWNFSFGHVNACVVIWFSTGFCYFLIHISSRWIWTFLNKMKKKKNDDDRERKQKCAENHQAK